MMRPPVKGVSSIQKNLNKFHGFVIGFDRLTASIFIVLEKMHVGRIHYTG